MKVSLLSSTMIAMIMYILMGIFCVVTLESAENVQPYMESNYGMITIVPFSKTTIF